jgi:uncharacterized protein with transglutaminase domain
MTRKIKIILLVCLFFGLIRGKVLSVTPTLFEEMEATESAIMLPNSEIEPTPIVEKQNITEPQDEVTKSRLAAILEEQEVGSWNGINTLRKGIRWAVDRGVPASTIVLIFLLPLVATVVSILHYVVGLTGFGIFTPTMMAVTFLNTGIVGGLVLFLVILGMSLVGRMLTSKLKIHYWPSRSKNLLFVCIMIGVLMFASSYLEFLDISQVSIFTILFMVMLAEDFVRTQLVKSKKEAKRLTVGTLALSIMGAVIMNISLVQEKVLLYPEMAVLIVLFVNLWVGNYKGIRLSEFKRFGKAIRN